MWRPFLVVGRSVAPSTFVVHFHISTVIYPKFTQNAIWLKNSCLMQQHGSVFWKKGACQVLRCLDPEKPLHKLLQVKPVWEVAIFLQFDYCSKIFDTVLPSIAWLLHSKQAAGTGIRPEVNVSPSGLCHVDLPVFAEHAAMTGLKFNTGEVIQHSNSEGLPCRQQKMAFSCAMYVWCAMHWCSTVWIT